MHNKTQIYKHIRISGANTLVQVRRCCAFVLLSAALLAASPAQMYAQALSTELNNAYYRNSHWEAKRFFRKWEKQSKPAKPEDMNDTLRHACDLIEDYLTMIEHKKRQEFVRNPRYPIHKYMLIEPRLNIYMKDSVVYSQEYIAGLKRSYEDKLRLMAQSAGQSTLKPVFAPHFGYELYGYMNAELVDSVSAFRPSLELKHKKLLYLTPEYLRAINLYLGADGNSLARGTFKQTLRGSDITRRLEFINRYLPIQQGRIIDFHINTYPAPYAVTFDFGFEHARIDFISGEQIGFALFKRAGSEWVFLFSSITGTI